jgi:leishmanolysin-like peptidase
MESVVKVNRDTPDGVKQVFAFQTPKVLAEARAHFGCNSIDYVYLENEGSELSAGAHFEKIHFGNELMTSAKVGQSVISRLTLALLEDTNWYKADYT